MVGKHTLGSTSSIRKLKYRWIVFKQLMKVDQDEIAMYNSFVAKGSTPVEIVNMNADECLMKQYR